MMEVKKQSNEKFLEYLLSYLHKIENREEEIQDQIENGEDYSSELEELSIKRDYLESIINDFIYYNITEIDVEVIIDTLEKMGHQISIITNEGYYAVSADGVKMADALDEVSDAQFQFYVYKDEWQPSLINALKKYIEKC